LCLRELYEVCLHTCENILTDCERKLVKNLGYNKVAERILDVL
jgi:hypothetical protein